MPKCSRASLRTPLYSHSPPGRSSKPRRHGNDDGSPCLLQSRIKMDSPRLGDICQNIGISIYSRTEIITPSTNLEREILSGLFEFPRDASFTRFPWPAKADRLGSLASHDAHSLSLSLSLSPSSQLLTLSRKTRVVEEDLEEGEGTEKRKKGLRMRGPRERGRRRRSVTGRTTMQRSATLLVYSIVWSRFRCKFC